ncbi:DltD N-terminal domain protein [Astrocystis sublimbata]|nr:DltD N-terminal domain protein [Astrocystis sublimbata]
MQGPENVEFQTLDGVTIRGHLYPAAERSITIIMTPGFNTTKDMFLPIVARFFQNAGFTTLTYDHRTTGGSDGTPRNNINPAQQVADYSDALTFLKADSRVDADRIIFWGFSMGGVVALSAAALDRRAKLAIAVCPPTLFDIPPRVLSKAIEDRESILAGNAPTRVPMVTAQGVNPAGVSGVGSEEQHLIAEAAEKIPSFEPTTTLQTYYNIRLWSPFHLIPLISPTPVLIVSAENDTLSPPSRQTECYYEPLQGPKEHYLIPGRGHINALEGDTFGPAMDAQVDFIRRYL